MCQAILHLLILMTLSCHSLAENETNATCPEHQRDFRGSCFEFVGIRRSFFSAQAWCEGNGGHLAFIPDKDTQYFLERHMDTKEDFWFGVAPSAEGHLSWLDGSPLTYSKWVSSPEPGAACGYILRNSGFHWEARNNCTKNRSFICQFESGRTIVCEGRNTTLQCGSGQVLMIDGGFYGRKSIHYCRSKFPPPASPQHECGWADAVESITARCHGRQVCQIAEVANSFADPCPQLKSYLSVDYHCKDGLALSVNPTAVVLGDVRIHVKWLLHSPLTNLSCRVNTGDGHVIYLNNPKGLENSVVHKYTHPSTFIVAAECTCSEMHITAQKIITIQEPVAEIGVIKCYAGNLSFSETNCKALYGEAFHIQMEVKAGTNVTYRIESDEKSLSGLSVIGGTEPQNITVTSEMVTRLGSGCHRLTLYASNTVTFLEVSKDLQVCVLEKIVGLQASVLTASDECLDSPFITFGVSLVRGEPVLLLFSLTGDNGLFTETRKMNTKKEMFHIKRPVQGSIEVKLRAWNIFSSLEVVLDMSASCDNDKHSDQNDILFGINNRQRKKHVRVGRAGGSSGGPGSSSGGPGGSSGGPGSSSGGPGGSSGGPGGSSGGPGSSSGGPGGSSGGPGSSSGGPGGSSGGPGSSSGGPGGSSGGPGGSSGGPGGSSGGPGGSSGGPGGSSGGAGGSSGGPGGSSGGPGSSSGGPGGSSGGPGGSSGGAGGSSGGPGCSSGGAGGSSGGPGGSSGGPGGSSGGPGGSSGGAGSSSGGTGGSSGGPGGSSGGAGGSSGGPGCSSGGPGGSSGGPGGSSGGAGSSSGGPGGSSGGPGGSSGGAGGSSGGPAGSSGGAGGSSGGAGGSSGGPGGSSGGPGGSSGTSPSSTVNPTTKNPGGSSSLSCSISPQSGTILDAFDISCNTENPCSNCQYCFSTQSKTLRCSQSNEAKSIFLPRGDSNSNYNLNILATATSGAQTVLSTTITAQVMDSTLSSSSVENVVDQLKAEGQLSPEVAGQLFSSVANKLNSQSDPAGQADRQKLRQKMLDIMIAVVNDNLTKSPQDIQALATALASLIKKGTEINTSAQEGAASLFANLSSSLLHMDLNATEVFATANNIVEGISNMLDYCPSKNTSDGLLGALFNIQSAMLSFVELNEDSSIIQQTHVKVLVRRVLPAVLYTGSVNITNCTCITFSLPQLPSTILPSDKPVDVRMLNLDVNPFCWKVGWDISRFVGSLSLTTKEGSVIPVENLSEDIQVVFPRFAGEQVNTTILDLGNFSTTVIDIPSANSTLVLKMMPSKVPLPFKVLLGYNDYPTETNYVAATEMPQQGATQEEKYTWLLHPEDLKGNTGVHYLVVRPIVGPGIKSINASLSITPITTSCKFWNESLLDWSNSGCRVGANTTHLETQCLCNHLTFFGNSFFVTPNLVDPSRTAELFATFANNPVVVCFVAALFLAYLLVLVWARRKDIQDTVKVKVTELEDNDPMDEYRYLLSVCTGHRIGASTSSQVTVTLLGTEGHSEPHHLTDSKKRVFERGAVDMFLLTTPFSLGDLQGIRLWHNNSGSHPAWYVGNVMVQDLQTEEKWHFLCNSWLSVDIDDCSLDKIFPAASEMDLKRFSNLFFTKTTKDFKDGHLWISVISRPPSSHFTRVQRVSCCFSLLLCTMLTSIMFYGIPTDPSQQVMDLGSFEFTWQQFMIGVQSSLIMFPVNILIVSIFRFTRPREFSCCHRKKKKKNTQDSSATTDMTNSVSLDVIIKDITRIAHSLSKTIKSNVTCKEFKFVPEQDNDVNAILSVLKDLITQNNTASENIETKTQPQLSDSSASAEGVIQKKRNKSQYLYRQLCRIDSELSQLGPSGFPKPHSYKQALQQVQSMKKLLEDQLVASNRGVPDEPTNKTASPSDSTDGDGAEKKRTCCHGGLPWWFIFVGWLLVIATSVVSGYFTMLYGLKFGKPRSISWLVSMVISFFQSVLLIQPLKVLCFAIFFALVIKKVDEEDFQNVQFERNQRNIGEQMFVRYGSVYEPPPHADVERMRRNRMLEQKAFALIREILIYMGFLWMLLLVAHGQRDPNAFYLNTHITQSFCRKAPATMAIQDVFNWASTSVLSNLFGQYPGFITDGNSKLLGNARLRQLRVKKNSCQIAGPMLKMVPDCSAPYSWEAEDMGSYGPGWNTSVGNNISASISSPWTYQTHSQLRAYPVWGELALYRGGGFSVELGPDLQTATSTLDYLFNNMWFDMYTRAIFVEFTVYNANVNLLCIVTLLLESPAVGAFQLNSEMQSVHLYLPGDGLHICIITTEIIYMLFILYYMFNQGKLMKQQRWLYFKNKWNLLELSIILLSWSAVAAFIQKTLIANRDIAYYQNHKDKFVSFYQTGTSESLFQYLMAFLVLLATVKLWHLLRLNPKMNMITAALQRAWTNISGLLLIIVIMLLAYSIACNVIYGWKLSSYKTFMDALMTLIGLQIGIFNYDEVLSSNPVLGGLLIGSCIVFVTFVVLNLLLSVILVAFNQEQKYHKPSEEEEIVDLMLMKICSLFGIKRKHAKDTRESDMSLAQNNNRNIFNTSSPDANIFQMSDKYVNP
ncbi:polycystic kidney disease protein 1-like 2 isoform X2 [Oreochromis niloticus]|uniref:polycystic kidney disease protein 1-like 2 isoform X2 n=1 Tax=Oreochromis niloticus TaxID=8128 RepID=UPI000905CD0E|nr:polycystic kidney disease protein 1-like 2 isoform X2 [Oreochromis niloticus]